MAQAKKKETPQIGSMSGGQVFNIEGGVHAQGDVVMGNQTKYNIQTPADFLLALKDVQAQVAVLKQGQLTSAQERNIEVVEARVVEAVAEVQQPQPLGEKIRAALLEAKETLDLLTGSLQSAAGLGMTIAGLAELAKRLFGG